MYRHVKINDDLKKYIEEERQILLNGVQTIINFPNNYGASIISGRGTYENKEKPFELAVLYENELSYNTPIADDVIGYLTDEEVNEILYQIKSL